MQGSRKKYRVGLQVLKHSFGPMIDHIVVSTPANATVPEIRQMVKEQLLHDYYEPTAVWEIDEK